MLDLQTVLIVGRRRTDQLTEQSGHRFAFISEDPDIALRCGERDRPSKRRHSGDRIIAGHRKRSKHLDLDHAPRSAILGGSNEEAVEQREHLDP